MRRIIQILLIIAFIVWVVEWFWWFGFSFSSRIFQQPNWRLFYLSLEMLTVIVPPLSGYWVVTRTLDHKVGTIRAFVMNIITTGLPVIVLWAFLEIWVSNARRAGQLYISADTAMGMGITFLFCFFVFLAVNLAAVCFLVAYALFRKYMTKNQRENKCENYST